MWVADRIITEQLQNNYIITTETLQTFTEWQLAAGRKPASFRYVCIPSYVLIAGYSRIEGRRLLKN